MKRTALLRVNAKDTKHLSPPRHGNGETAHQPVARNEASPRPAMFRVQVNGNDRLARAQHLRRQRVSGLVGGDLGDAEPLGVLDLLEEVARRCLVWVEYGLQSARDATLAAIHRGHDAACFLRALEAAHRRGIPVCAHVILGLPGETAADARFTADTLAAAGVDGVKLHNLYVVRGTRLDALFRSGAYRCLERQEYVDQVVDVLERLPARTVVQRLTGDPHPEELAAPSWSREKATTLKAIHETLERRDTWQGKLCGNGAPVFPAVS